MEANKIKAKVIRGVYVRGVAYGEGAIVGLSPQEFDELKSTYYVVAATPEDEKAVLTALSDAGGTLKPVGKAAKGGA